MGMRVKGLQRAINRCDKFEDELEEAVGNTVEQSTEDLYKQSQIQVPKKTGKLAGSGRFVSHIAGGLHQSRGVKYGYQTVDSSDESVLDYAAAVHEILKASHAAPTKAKFVEDPLVQGVADYHRFGIQECKKAVRRAFR